MAEDKLPPLPPGFKLQPVSGGGDTGDSSGSGSSGDGAIPPLPPGFKLQPTARDLKPYKMDKNTSAVTGDDLKSIRKFALPALGATAAGLATGGAALLPAMGAAALGGFGGSIAEQGIETARGESDAPKGGGEMLKRAGVEGLENGLMEGGGRLVTGALEKTLERYFNPERLYQSALKPTGTLEKNAGKSVKTGIAEGIPVKEESRGAIGQRINQLGQSVERMIQASPDQIPAGQFVKNIQGKFDALRTQWGKDATKGAQFVDRINDMERQFLEQHGNPAPIVKTVQVPSKSGLVGPNGQPAMVSQTITIEPKDMTLAELRQQARPLGTTDAQAIKKQTYETIRTANKTAWDAGNHPGLDVRANKEIARALREELEQVYPGIKALNARQGALIGLEEQLERFTKREMNRQVTSYGLFGTAGMALGGLHGGAEGAGVGGFAGLMLRRALEDPGIKSRIAITLDQMGKKPALKAAAGAAKKINLPAAALRTGAGYVGYQEDKTNREQQQPDQ